MVQQPSSRPSYSSHSADFDHHVVLFPTRPQSRVAPEVRGKPADLSASERPGRVRTHVIRGVAVVEVSGQLSGVVEKVDLAIQLALAEGPCGVVCDLSGVSQGASQIPIDIIEALATAGRHARDWPGVPVAMASSVPRVREALRSQPLGQHLIVTPSLFSAVAAVLATPALDVRCRRLVPHPTAPRAAREFVTHTLLEWHLGRVLPFASLVVSELVASSAVDAGTEIDLSVVWDKEALRLTVRDRGPALPGQQPSPLHLVGRRLTLVAGLSRAFGVLPTSEGGKVVWAVLDAPSAPPETDVHSPAVARQEALVLQHARALADTPFLADSRSQPTRRPPAPKPRGALTLVR